MKAKNQKNIEVENDWTMFLQTEYLKEILKTNTEIKYIVENTCKELNDLICHLKDLKNDFDRTHNTNI